MGVTTTKTNKPLNPRGNDQSPLAYNRAKLYSGKALDFDGVNDSVSVSSITDTYKSFCFYFKPDADINDASSLQRLFGIYEQYFGISTGAATGSVTGETLVFMPNSGGRFGTRMEFTANTWYHIAVVAKESDNTYLIYINAQDKTDFSVNTHTPTAATDLKLAVANNGGPHFNGQIANFKAFNVALTAAQVADLYNNPEKVVPTGVDNTALKLWLPMMEGAGTTAYDGSGNNLGSEEITNGDFSGGSQDWTKETGWTISGGKASFNGSATTSALYQNIGGVSGKRYIISFEVTDYVSGSFKAYLSNGDVSAATPSITANGKYVFDITATGVLCLFRNETSFNGSIDNVSVKELTSYGVINGATWTNGIGAPVAQTAVINWNKYNTGANAVLIPQGLTAGRDLLGNLFENVRKQGALNLDGNSWAEVHDNASVDLTDAITLEAWVYWDGTASDDGIFGRWGDSSGAKNYMLYAASNTRVDFYINNSDSRYEGITTGWHHIVGTYDKSNRKL